MGCFGKDAILHKTLYICTACVLIVHVRHACCDISSRSPVPPAKDKLHCHLMELALLLTESQGYIYLKYVNVKQTSKRRRLEQSKKKKKHAH